MLTHRKAAMFAALTAVLLSVDATPAPTEVQTQPPGWNISVETDPVFWVGALPQGAAIDGNLDFHFAAVPGLRVGVLGWWGTLSGGFAKSAVLTEDFTESGWQVLWAGAGIEAQYQFHFGLERGGLQLGARVQWNQFRYRLDGVDAGVANQLAVTPQLGFQWFPCRGLGLYLLPWAGAQLPVAGTDHLEVSGANRSTRRVLPVVTVHLGWEF